MLGEYIRGDTRGLYDSDAAGPPECENGRTWSPAEINATLTGLEPATSAVTGRRANQLRHRAIMIFSGTPNGIRTRVAAVKGRSPRPLDDGSPT